MRDVYYSSQAFAIEFDDQSESDNIIVDLEAVTSKPREDFHIFPEERSLIFGDLNIEYTILGYEGKRSINFQIILMDIRLVLVLLLRN